MKKIIMILFALGLFAQEVYKVGLSPDFPPFEYMENGEIIGFEIDLVREIAKDLNIQIELVPMSFDGLIAAIKVGKIDIIASGMTYTPKRAKNVEFSIPIIESENHYIKLKSNKNLNSLKDLEKGAILGAQVGTLQADEISTIKGVKPFLNPEYMPLILSTLSGKIDGFVLESAVAKSYTKNYDDFEVFAKTPIAGTCLAFKKGNIKLRDDFDKTIEKFKKDGTYSKLLEKYNLN